MQRRIVRAQRRHLLLVAAVVPLAAMAIMAACGFPNPAIEGEDGGAPTPDGSNPETGTDANMTPDAQSDATIFDGPVDVLVRDDATAKVDAAGCDAQCDCDKDGFHKIGVGCDASVAQNNVDCDDTDPVRHPGQLQFIAEMPVGHDGDWDCNNTVTKAYPETVTCQSIAGLGCTGGPAFPQSVNCGAAAAMFACEGSLLSCNPSKFVENRTQACR